ncbi:MAG: hypothetical protein EA427_09230 [Spirochaetaceae bacterium]|nr:MAG: hypothetical protein EA427_09230 [Spirochaetaceae bacterium]
MADLNVTFAGLALASPLIVEFCDEIPQQDTVADLAEAGIGAFLLPPLNETRLDWEADPSEMAENNVNDAARRESERIRRDMNRDAYLEKIAEIAEVTSVPVIASLQCARRNQWVNTAHMMSNAGASAIELHPLSEKDWRTSRSDRIEKEIIRTTGLVATRIDTPVVVRLVAAPYGMQTLVQSLGESSAKGVVLTGSDYLTTIDADSGTTDSVSLEGRRSDAAYMNALAALHVLYRRVTPHLAARIPADRVSALTECVLAGATLAVLPVTQPLEERARSIVTEHISTLHGWMRRKGYSSLFDFRGVLSDSRRSSSLENPAD